MSRRGPFTNATMVTVEGGPPGQRAGSCAWHRSCCAAGRRWRVLPCIGANHGGTLAGMHDASLLIKIVQVSALRGWEYPAAQRAFSEGPYIHKHNGKYYLSWTWLRGPGYQAYYAMGDNPLGPFEYKGHLTGRQQAMPRIIIRWLNTRGNGTSFIMLVAPGRGRVSAAW
jgi:hypothetical protein